MRLRVVDGGVLQVLGVLEALRQQLGALVRYRAAALEEGAAHQAADVGLHRVHQSQRAVLTESEHNP